MTSRFTPAAILLHTIRFIQLVLSIAVAGLYGRDLATKQKPESYTASKWVRPSRKTLFSFGIDAVVLIIELGLR